MITLLSPKKQPKKEPAITYVDFLQSLTTKDWNAFCEEVLENQSPVSRKELAKQYPDLKDLYEYIRGMIEKGFPPNFLRHKYLQRHQETLNPCVVIPMKAIRKQELAKKPAVAQEAVPEEDDKFQNYLKQHKIKGDKSRGLEYMRNLYNNFVVYRKSGAKEREIIVLTVLHKNPLFQPISDQMRKKLTVIDQGLELDYQREIPLVYKTPHETCVITGPYLCYNDAKIFHFILSFFADNGIRGSKAELSYRDLEKTIHPKVKIRIDSPKLLAMKRSLVRLCQTTLGVSCVDPDGEHFGFQGSLLSCSLFSNGLYSSKFQTDKPSSTIEVTLNPYLLHELYKGHFSHADGDLVEDMTQWESKLLLMLTADKFEEYKLKVDSIKELFGKRETPEQNAIVRMCEAIKELKDKEVLDPKSCVKDGVFYLYKTKKFMTKWNRVTFTTPKRLL